jgi:glycerone phosphate O-acyltransferase
VFRYINSVNRDEMKLIQDMATEVVRQQQRHLVVSPWAIMATVLIQNRDGISVSQLVRESDWLKRQAQNYGAYVDWPGISGHFLRIFHWVSTWFHWVSIWTHK